MFSDYSKQFKLLTTLTPSKEAIEEITKSGKIRGLAYTAEPKLGFPEYRRGGLLQLFRKVPFGWEIRGKTNRRCTHCGKRAFVGKEQKSSFLFCKVCLNKKVI